ncbi:MAG: hypothetical protein CMG81_02210 [Marinobacter sp.]|nr:hypothetical protein [Marinobacter sp.]|tara:strand:+ start:14706 stop:15728 length:1023 start_codon:yes stop_codon:yes gene_type:complete
MSSYCKFITALSLIFVLLLSGCATPPWLKDAWATPEYQEADLTHDEQIRLGYLARYLADSDTRAKLESEILKTDYVRQWDTYDYATTTSMATDVIEGQIASDLGAGLGAAVMVVGLLSGDGSMDYISQAFLPAEIEGHVIDSVKDARIAVNDLIRHRLESIAETLGTKLECAKGCSNHPDSIFVLRLPPDRSNEQFIYWPSDIVITVDVGGATAVSQDDPISSLVGFPVAWKTQPGNSAEIRLYSEGSYDSNGQLAFEANSAGRKINPIVKYDLEQTALGRAILTEVYSDTRLIRGSQKTHPHMVFFNGEVYGFISNFNENFVNKTVDVLPLTDQKVRPQ